MTAAHALLVAVADGAPEAIERAHELALADIEARGGHLALQVLSGGEFALARAVELARVLLETPAREAAPAGRASHE